MRNDSSIKKYYHCSSSRHRAHHRRTTKSPFPRSGSTSDTRDPFVNRYPTHPVIRKACRPRKGQRIPIPRKRLYRCKETARASQRTNERTSGRASERASGPDLGRPTRTRSRARPNRRCYSPYSLRVPELRSKRGLCVQLQSAGAPPGHALYR